MTTHWLQAEEGTADSVSVDNWSDGSEFWNKVWELGFTRWHQQEVNSLLSDNIGELTNNREHLRIFVPLCGKTVDLRWLAEEGHTVVGVDCAQLAMESFFNEQSLDFSKEPVDAVNGFRYKCTTLPLSLYCCDITEFDKVGEERFDAVWDRGSLNAIRRDDVSRYVEILCLMSSDDCRCLLETFEYDKQVYGGPPASYHEDDVNKLFGEHFICRKLSSEPDEEKLARIAPESSFFNVCCWLLTRK